MNKEYMKTDSDAVYAEYYSDIEKEIIEDGYVPDTSMENLISMIVLFFDDEDNYGRGGYGDRFPLEECFRYVTESGGWREFDYVA